MRTPWDEPVMLACQKSGQFFLVATTEEAYQCLVSSWPTAAGRAFFAALEICNNVSIGKIDPKIARQAFINAAEEAGIAIQKISVVGPLG